MARLASAVGISKSGLYAHFKSKEELQLAAVERFLEVFEAEVLDGLNDELGPLLERWLSFYERKVYSGGCFLVVEAVAYACRPGPVLDSLTNAIDQQIAALEATIDRANQAGELTPKQDPPQTAFELHSILIGAHALFQVKQDPAVFGLARAAIRKLLG